MSGAEVLPVLLLLIVFGLAIRPAIHHDNEQPVSATGKARR